METTNLGRIGPVPQGDFKTENLPYRKYDMVMHNGDGYISMTEDNNEEPGTGQNWKKIVEKGLPGPKGDTFVFDDLTPAQKEELKGDVIAYNSLDEADRNDLASRVPITGVVEEGNTQAVSGGEVYGSLSELSNDLKNPGHLYGIKTIAHTGINLFDKSSITDGGYYNGSGVWVPNNNFVVSDFIPVSIGVYQKNDWSTYTLYDANKNFLASATNIIPNIVSAKFVRLNIPKSMVDIYMFCERDKYPSSYVPFNGKYELDSSTFIFDNQNGNPDETSEGTVVRILENVNSIRNVLLGDQEPIELDLPDFSGYNQPFHPSVIYIPNGFAGYRYWMSQTPYPIGGSPYRDRWECPIVYKSTDGIEWEIVANPLDDLTPLEITNKGYFSDSHILFRPDLNRLEVWYRLSPSSVVDDIQVILYRKTTTDGVNWTEREEMFPSTDYRTIDNHRSPSILWDNSEGKYRMWYTANQGKFYKTSDDGFNWSSPTAIDFNVPNNDWHIDVNYYQGKYHYIGYARGSEHINYYSSDDGINFRFEKILLQSKFGGPLYSIGLYRAVSILDEQGKVRLYFSGVKPIQKTCIGLIIADSLLEMTDQVKINGKYVTTSSGKSVNDLESEIEVLRQLINS